MQRRSSSAHRDLLAKSRQRFPTCYGPEFVAMAVQKWITAVGAKII
jgi:hypothetical protein